MDIPAMESHKTLKLIMDSLFSDNILKNCSIFADNKCGATVLKIRFTKPEVTASGEDSTNESVTPVTYRRTSQKQSRRDYERKTKHDASKLVMTRSKASENYTHVELPRVSRTDVFSETPSISPVVCEEPDPVIPDTNTQSLNCDSPPVCDMSLHHGSADISEQTDNDASTNDSWCDIISHYKNIEPNRKRNVFQIGHKCSKCLRSCDLKSESSFGFKTLSCNYHDAIICTGCYPISGHITKCKMKKVIFHV